MCDRQIYTNAQAVHPIHSRRSREMSPTTARDQGVADVPLWRSGGHFSLRGLVSPHAKNGCGSHQILSRWVTVAGSRCWAPEARSEVYVDNKTGVCYYFTRYFDWL